jgi:hypothetical protein
MLKTETNTPAMAKRVTSATQVGSDLDIRI